MKGLIQIERDLRLEARSQLALSNGEKDDPHRAMGRWLVKMADDLFKCRKAIGKRMQASSLIISSTTPEPQDKKE